MLPPGLIGEHRRPSRSARALDFATLASNDSEPLSGRHGDRRGARDAQRTANASAQYTEAVPVFNLVPAPGEPARFGFEVDKVPVVLDTRCATGSDYARRSQRRQRHRRPRRCSSSQVTFWGVPGDPRHDSARGWACIGGGDCVARRQSANAMRPAGAANPPAFLTLPTSCAGTADRRRVTRRILADAASESSAEQAAGERIPRALEGCDQLPFDPAITSSPKRTRRAPRAA